MNLELKECWEKYWASMPKPIIYKNTLLTEHYLPVADSIENFEVYEDDIWLCGIPKSGTTWAQELIWTTANDLNFEAAKANITERFPYFEYSALFECKAPAGNETNARKSYFKNSIEYLKKLPRPRFLKTHLPFHLLPRRLRTNEKNAKIVFVWRNPKDVCISLYNYKKWNNTCTSDFTDFCKLFLNDGVLLAPYWHHTIEFWKRRNESNILVLKYEDMKADLDSEIRKVANFLGKNLNEDEILKLQNHLSFRSMRANPAVNRENLPEFYGKRTDRKFMHKGEAGQWKTEMSCEMIDQFDKWIYKNFKDNESLLREIR